MKILSIIIPVYNEAASIGRVLAKVRKVLLPGIRKEIIVVNDGSTDATAKKIRQAGRGFKIYDLVLNLGKGAAVRLGMAKASGNIVIIQDADLELDPTEYWAIINPILEGRAKVVYGSRFKNEKNKISLKTRLANYTLTTITNLLFGSRLSDMETAYKAFDRGVLSGIRLSALRFEIEPEITARVLQKEIPILEVPINYRPRTKDQGKKIRFKDGLSAIYTLLRCRFWP